MTPEDVTQWMRSALPRPDLPVVWLFDVDDTLTDTQSMHHRAAESLESGLAASMGADRASSVSRRFRTVFDELLLVHQQSPVDDERLRSLRELEERVRDAQREISEKWGTTRLFSREILLHLAAEDCGVPLAPDELRQAVDHYWDHMLKHPLVYPDAVRMLRKLESRRAPVYLMTSSDARYRPKADGGFGYDPRASRHDKRRRMVNLREHGIRYAKSFIGDPTDKPSEEFFDLVFSGIAEDLGSPRGEFSVVAVGDSYRSDIQTPLALVEEAVGILCRRKQPAARVESDRALSVGDLDMVTEYLDGTERGHGG
ncbi:HAD family hydrolase [Streptomyces sp. BBFR25]|uniref:HAD family hydrolase n=1 Tax=Streptomyces sp. BBFR25 TaxID=3372855 RepID=UPI0037DD6746